MFNIKCNHQIAIDKKNEFIAKILPKEKVCIETVNAYGDRFENINELMKLINSKDGKTHHHPLTGPIYIESAKPGDVLKVHIYKIDAEEMAQSMSKTAGIDPIESSEVLERVPVIAKRLKNELKYLNNIKLKYRPMIGIIATTPDGDKIKTGHARIRNGGNLDLPFVTENTDIYLPIDIEGAGLYLGDIHSLQSYGELSGIAMEASSKIVLDVKVLKPNEQLDNILIIGKEPLSRKESIGVVGIGEKMKMEASVYDAFQGTYKLLKQMLPKLPKNIIKSLITLVGNSLNGQAFSKTSESTSIVVITKEDIERITKSKYTSLAKEIEKILFEKNKKGGKR